MLTNPDITKIMVGSMGTNCYIISDNKSCEAVILDPGDDGDYITQVISDKKLIPTEIVATHGHFDHILSVTELKLIYKIPFCMHANDQFLLKTMSSSVRHYLNITAGPTPVIDHFIQAGDIIKIGRLNFHVLETPGHTPGSICLYHKRSNNLFVGDLLFAGGGVGRVDFSYSDANEMEESLDLINKLPSGTMIYPGHGEFFKLRQEEYTDLYEIS